jgi:16S rRNA (cytosine967-C5)-methyltransferase
VAELWARVRARPEMAGPTISEALREARWLGSKERRQAGDFVLGLIRHERALALVDPDPITAWVRLAEEGPPEREDPDHAFAIAASVPDDLGAEWWARLGPERAVAFARSMAGRAPVCLRILRGPVEIPVRHRYISDVSVVLEEGANIESWPAFREGRLMVQDLGSQRIADAAFPGAGARVIDLCAGAGGKSLALAARGARVQAWDVRRGALDELGRRARRSGLPIEVAPPRGRYDLVLVDAPCSGTGVLRRHPENRWKLAFPTDVQAELLRRALGMGDRVVYATCALTLRENEELVRSVGRVVTEELIWPEEGGTEGFYWAEVGR